MGFDKKKIPLLHQYGRVRRDYKNWTGSSPSHKLVLKGSVQPTSMSPVYLVKITYSHNIMPQIEVLSPSLKIHPGKHKLPHIFEGDMLCLHFKEFSHYKSYIANTIIVWVTWWLYFYEIWLVTGEWKGGGIEHIKTDDNKNES